MVSVRSRGIEHDSVWPGSREAAPVGETRDGRGTQVR